MASASSLPTILSAIGLRRRFGSRTAVDGVSLELHTGEIVGLLGPNGAGKTVTFYMLVGLLPPTAGRILLDGRDITKLAMFERARRGIAYLPQERSVFGGLSAEENVAAVLECRGWSRRDARRRASAVLDDFGILALAKTKAARLSGGEQRRLEVARAIALEPRFLLLDEPFSGIDPITVETIHRLLVELNRRGIGILLTDHNVREALLLSQRAYVLFDGRVLAEGDAATLLQNPEVRRRFLGETFNFEREGIADTGHPPRPTDGLAAGAYGT